MVLPCSSELATLSAVFSDCRALLRSNKRISSGLLSRRGGDDGDDGDDDDDDDSASLMSSAVRWGPPLKSDADR